MEHKSEAMKSIERRRRRVRQIRRRVCLMVLAAVCMIAVVVGVAVHAAGKEKQPKAAAVYVLIESPAAVVICNPTAAPILQITDGQEETGQQDKPVFVALPVPMSEEDQKIVFDICEENGVAFSFVMAIIGKESEFTKEARSGTGDSGYMQINDCNASAMAERGFVDMFDTADNIGAGVSILRDLFDRYGDDEVHRVLMAYNMGQTAAADLWAQGIESSAYSRAIVEREEEYSRYMDEYLKGR